MEVTYESPCRSHPCWVDDRCGRPDFGVGISMSGPRYCVGAADWPNNKFDLIAGQQIPFARIRICPRYLALLWQIAKIIGVMGFPNHFFCDSWVVGFWRADHEEHPVGLGRRTCTLAQTFPGAFGS